MALRILLIVLGISMAIASRWREAFRRQLTRDVVIEISSDDGVARQFVCRSRRISSRSGRASSPDCVLRFDTAQRGFSMLTARDGPARLFDGLLDGTARIEGNTALFSWFSGLVRAVVPGAPALRLPATPPGAYVRPSSSATVSRFITREAPEPELDRSWTLAVEARKKLPTVRVAGGERPKPF